MISLLQSCGTVVFLVVLGFVSIGMIGGRFPRSRRWIAVGFLAVVAACILWWVRSFSFHSEDWKADKGGSERRARMYDDLVRSHRIVGMTRTDVTALLGKPDEATPGPFARDMLPGSPEFNDYQPDEELIYYLGSGGFFPVDTDVMYLYLKGGVVDRFGWRPT